MLVVAGALKRSDKGRAEDQVLMRALRDFNIPKIVTDDLPVFMGLIGDLFPAMDVPRKRDLDFEGDIRKAVLVSVVFYSSFLCHLISCHLKSFFQKKIKVYCYPPHTVTESLEGCSKQFVWSVSIQIDCMHIS